MAKDKTSKKSKVKKIKLEKYRSEEQMEVIRFIRILVIVVVLIIGIYFFTKLFVVDKELKEESPIAGTINYSITMIGSMLIKPEEEYYVMIYNTKNLRSVYYSGLMSNYEQNENHLKIYFADLDKEFNQKFYDPENINLDIEQISDLKVGDLTLIKVKDGAIDETFTDEEEVASELAYIEVEEDTQN